MIERTGRVVEKTVKDFEGHDLAIDWSDGSAHFTFKSLAFTIKGSATVAADQVVVEIDLPFAAMMFKDKVERAITKNLTRAIEEAS
ncbi:MAG: polyhydroxyalkanoic acid system family protein [Pirellulales bacterium]